MVLTLVSTLLGMTVYEVTKTVVFPKLAPWESQTITIIFTGLLATGVAYILGRRQAAQHARSRQVEQEFLLFRTLLDRANDAIEIIDPGTGRFLDVNERACTTHGYTRSEYLGLSVLDIDELVTHWPPPEHTAAAQQVGFAIVTGRHRRKDGSTFPVEVNVNFIQLDRAYVVAVVRDITERKQAEAALRASEERFRRITVNMLDMVSQTDTAGIVQYVTPSNQAILGYRPQEMIGQSIFAFLHPEDRDRGRGLFQEGLASQTPQRGEFRFRHADGHYLCLETVGNLLRDEEGQVGGAVLASRDITERKRSEEQLRLEGTALESAANGIVITDRRGDMVWVNQAFTRMTGYTLEEAIGQNPRLLKSGQQDPSFYEQLWSTIRAGHVWQGELINRRKDGTLYTEEMTITPVRAQGGGAITHFIAIKQDVTQRKQTEEALRVSEERFALAVQGTNDAIWDWDLVTNQVYFSPRYKAMLGYTDAEIESSYEEWEQRLHPDDRAGTLQQLRDYLEGRTASYQPEFRLRCKDGSYCWILARAAAVRAANGKPTRLTGSHTDVTERKQAEAEIRQLNAELEQRVHDRTVQLEAANKELEAFAYSVSHDLRTPLRAIDGFSQALLEDYHDKLDADGQRCLQRVRAASQRMGKLIDDILQLSRMTRGTMSQERVDLTELAERLLGDLRTADPTRRVDCRISPGLTAEGDPRLLEIALQNLLGNAWKFTSKTAAARIEFGSTEREGRPAFVVRDNGAGFDMAYAHRLFGAFQRLHSEAEFPGTGIGLATVQRIIHRHGGQIWVEAAVGQGAAFYFTLKPPAEKYEVV